MMLLSKPSFRLSLFVLLAACAQANPGVGEKPDATVNADGGGDAAGDTSDAKTMPRCISNGDCAASPAGTVCDTTTGTCVQCTVAQDMCPAGQVCDPMTNACRTGCSNDTDCASTMGSRVRCDVATRRCIGCELDSDCALGTVCRMGTCVPGCNEGHACGIGNTCCEGQCVDLQADGMNCGTCGRACDSGGACCAGMCQPVQGDLRNCGRCGVVCEARNGSPACVMGACTVGTCDTGYGDCDRMASNGCEADLQTDAMHCGACGRACTSGPHATARCAMGRCVNECTGGFGDCDGDAANGCETDVAGDPANCGMCGRACPGGAGATATCAMGGCGLRCAPGTADCDMMASNGCETSTATSVANCGSCGLMCTFANAMASCEAGRCALATCRAGFDNCDGDPMNGCETPVTADNNNCGRCGNRCPTGTACSMGACGSICAGGTTFCAGRCVTLETDAMNCGACGRACPGGSNADPACRGGVCALACAAGYGDCDGSAATGCETNTRVAVMHCGACGRPCAVANATPGCVDGACRVSACAPGFANCNGADTDGCEVNVSADVANCGACGRACSLPNAGASCAGGSCRIGACSPGFANCNGSDADGCEVSLSTSNVNCGACGVSCPPGTACSSGSCASVCTGGTTFCAGACVNTGSDARNCGGCGNVCAAGQSCSGGVCRTAAPANDTCAGAQVISLASVDQTLSATTTGANQEVAAPCGFSGADVWFRFTLAQREFVYADTVGASYDTILYFATGCTTPATAPVVPGAVFCNDDMGSAGCTTGGLQSQIGALLNPGAYYLVLAGYGGASGPANIRFQHIPAGSGSVTLVGAGTNTYPGSTSGASAITASCGSTSSAPEANFWWRSCPETPGGAFSATTCRLATWDTVLYLRNAAGGGDVCNDDDFACTSGLQSTASSTLGAGAGLHVLYVDGYSGASGSFSVQIRRP